MPTWFTDLLEDLASRDNTFFVIYPDDTALDWSLSAYTRTNGLGGYEIERRDPATGQHDTTAAADHVTIVTEVLTWIPDR
ncbi:hypothetical protein [Promicromonospora iranensis]|uniref:Uncharacterized protein n=1 Tax=Promicromonospora iranensis TaxID=1105144 RepID=A0ABU2CIM5_9MICO|nr:hypothetical protein [Promicromonospora iranensis]MDR7381192.1 hypothetical protein [Promicromonospora iranensis]